MVVEGGARAAAEPMVEGTAAAALVVTREMKEVGLEMAAPMEAAEGSHLAAQVPVAVVWAAAVMEVLAEPVALARADR